MPTSLKLHNLNLEELARQYELTGAGILNVVHFAILQSYARNDGLLCQSDLIDGIKKEYLKEDKSF
jgi:hypothetical protein